MNDLNMGAGMNPAGLLNPTAYHLERRRVERNPAPMNLSNLRTDMDVGIPFEFDPLTAENEQLNSFDSPVSESQLEPTESNSALNSPYITPEGSLLSDFPAGQVSFQDESTLDRMARRKNIASVGVFLR